MESIKSKKFSSFNSFELKNISSIRGGEQQSGTRWTENTPGWYSNDGETADAAKPGN